MTLSVGRKIAARLNLCPTESDFLLKSIEAASTAVRGHFASTSIAHQRKVSLDQSHYELLSKPYHFSLLSLVELEDFQNDPSWIAKRLHLNPLQVRQGLECLRRHGLIRDHRDKLQLGAPHGVKSSDNVTNPALRVAHQSILDETAATYRDLPLELRDVTSLTLAIDPRKLEEAKLHIRRFRKQMEKLLEKGRKTEVYRLNIQLLPLSFKVAKLEES